MAKQPGGFGGSAESGLSTVDMCLPLLNCLTGTGPYPGVGSGCRGRGRGPFSTLSKDGFITMYYLCFVLAMGRHLP